MDMKYIYKLKNKAVRFIASLARFRKPRNEKYSNAPKGYIEGNKKTIYKEGIHSKQNGERAPTNAIMEQSAPLIQMREGELEGINQYIAHANTKLAHINSKLNTPPESRVSYHKELLTQQQLKQEKDLLENKKATEAILSRIRKDQNDIEARIATIRKFWKYVPVKKSIWDKNWGIGIAIASNAVLETAFTVPALANNGIPDILTIPAALIFSGIMGVCADQTGEAFIQEKKKMTWAWFGAGVASISLIILTRRGMEQNLVLSGLNFIIYFFGVLLSIRRYKHKVYWDLIDKRNELAQQDDKVSKELEQYNQSTNHVKIDIAAQAKINAKNEEQNLTQQKETLEGEIEELKSNKTTIMNKYNTYLNQVAAIVRSGFNDG